MLPQCVRTSEDDWRTEYLAPILAIRIVTGLDAAIEHINHYSSAHTDAIITEDYTRARRFLREVDSSSVMVNASTRFADQTEGVYISSLLQKSNESRPDPAILERPLSVFCSR